MSDHSELKRLAEAATPGPWAYDGSYVCPARTEDGTTYVELWRSIADCHQPENTKFIAAANPAAVLALIAEVEGLRAQHGRDSAELRSLCQARDDARKERDQLKAEVETLTAAAQALRDEWRKDQAEVERLKHQVSAGSAREWDLRSQVRSARETRAHIVLSNKSLRGQVETLVEWQANALNDAEALRKDKDRLDALEANFWDVRHTSTQVGMEGDTSQSIEIVGSWMDAPRERVIGENYSENLRAAIDQAMTSDAYPPARPEYEEDDL